MINITKLKPLCVVKRESTGEEYMYMDTTYSTLEQLPGGTKKPLIFWMVNLSKPEMEGIVFKQENIEDLVLIYDTVKEYLQASGKDRVGIYNHIQPN